MYRHSGLLSKGQRRGGNRVYRHKDLYLSLRVDVEPHFTSTQALYLKVRGEVETQCTDT